MDWKKYFAIGSMLVVWPIALWNILHTGDIAFSATFGFVGSGLSLLSIGIIDQL